MTYGLIDMAMEYAGKKLRANLPNNQYTDDWQWNHNAFQFNLMLFLGINKDGKPREKDLGTYRWWFDDEDPDRNWMVQLDDWLFDNFYIG